MKVDFPPMFGPVMIAMLVVALTFKSFAMKASVDAARTTGCQPCCMFMPVSSEKLGQQKSSALARSAKQASTSLCANAFAASRKRDEC